MQARSELHRSVAEDQPLPCRVESLYVRRTRGMAFCISIKIQHKVPPFRPPALILPYIVQKCNSLQCERQNFVAFAQNARTSPLGANADFGQVALLMEVSDSIK